MGKSKMVMTKQEFYSLYIPALEKALDTDHINIGFKVKGPEDYIDTKLQVEIENYLEEHEDVFLEKVAYYFDAKSHNFPSIEGVEIEVYKKKIKIEINNVKKGFLDNSTDSPAGL
ncbi:hypothetical protein [Aquimarina mytili]|uniref:Uncharacterized protein n=1 Tax=Aquimarina mytili TaxID=874423 RepID=A0A937D9W6_9FLAO|nr:hypothetical protein [Aquimarina mytili]MBL0684117.1 hypothetical protein [Aquimarina mytili]